MNVYALRNPEVDALNSKKNYVLNILLKIFGIFFISMVSLFILLFSVMNIIKFAIYPEYYSIRTNVCKNPGLSDGFVCQDVCYYEEGEKFFVCGYMVDNSASRIYVTDTKNDSFYVSLSLEGRDFTGHSGGITTHGNEVYIASESSIHIIPLKDLLDAGNGDTVEITDVIKIDNEASSAASDENYLYIGEFCNDKNYFSYHYFDTPDGEYHAIIGCYSFDDLSAPKKVYSITEKVQGICFAPNGKIVLSASYGASDSYYYVYDENEAVDSGLFHEGAPVFFLCNPEKIIKGPAMAEGLDYYDGKIITLTEVASDKYFVGKFLFADKIFALDLFRTE